MDRFCIKCGKARSEKSKFCEKCGTQFDAVQPVVNISIYMWMKRNGTILNGLWGDDLIAESSLTQGHRYGIPSEPLEYFEDNFDMRTLETNLANGLLGYGAAPPSTGAGA